MLVVALVLASLAGPPTLFGVQPGMAAAAIKAAFAPEGRAATALWSTATEDGVEVLRFECAAQRDCFATPSAAEFRLIAGRLVDATFTLDAVRAPEGSSPNRGAATQLGPLGPPAIRTSAAGRQIRYYLGDGWSVAWAVDGPDGRIVLALDQHAPLTRAEAVAAGAPEAGLERLPGAKRYAEGHRAIGARAFAEASAHFEAVLAEPKAAPLLKGPTKLVLAMVLAAQVKADGRLDPTAERRLARAEALAPELKGDLAALRAQLKR